MKYPFSVLTLMFLFPAFSQYAPVDDWGMLVDGQEDWRYFVGNQEPSQNWRQIDFNDAGWKQAKGGIGFGNGDDVTEIDTANAIYLRKKFTVANDADIRQLMLYAQYDDGFVVYLNGLEIQRTNLGEQGELIAHDQAAEFDFVSNASQGKAPEHFLVDPQIIQRAITIGENTLAIQVHNAANDTTGLTAEFYLMAGYRGTSVGSTVPDWFTRPPIFESQTNLPVIRIHTNGQVIPDDDKITARMEIVYHGEGSLNAYDGVPNHYDGLIGIETRGQSSLEFPKYSFSLETRLENGDNRNVSLLGMPEENDWVLYAPYSDKSLIRNVLTYQLWEDLGHYSPRTRFCELFINGYYVGVFVFMERIKRDRDRLDISRLDPEDTGEENISGGYIIKVDKGDNVANSWDSDHLQSGLSFQYVYPRRQDITDEQKNYIQSFIYELEAGLINDRSLANVFAYFMDRGSAIDRLLIAELAKDPDSHRYSQFMYKKSREEGGKLHLGPVWDVNLGYGNSDYSTCGAEDTEGWLYDCGSGRMFWFGRMMQDETFLCRLQNRWISLRANQLELNRIMEQIDAYSLELRRGQIRNHYLWKTIGRYVWPNNFVGESYEEEITYLKEWITARLAWMDDQLLRPCDLLFAEGNQPVVYPNPFVDFVDFDLAGRPGDVQVSIFDLSGIKIWSATSNSSGNTSAVRWSPEQETTGVFVYTITSGGETVASGKVVRAN